MLFIFACSVFPGLFLSLTACLLTLATNSIENYGKSFTKLAVLQREQEMKKIICLVLLGITVFTFTFGSPALAADTASGAKIFSANCASCHMGGKNLVKANKTLKKSDLEKYGLNSEQAIISQVTNGKNAMPAFRGRLKTAQIENVAAYVLEQADQGW